LALLKQEALIRALPRSGYRVQPKPQAHSCRIRSKSLRICLFQEPGLEGSALHGRLIVRDIEHHLNAAGYELQAHVGWRAPGGYSAQRLEALVQDEHAAAWALIASSRSSQLWFARASVPVLVLGSCQPGIVLPSLDVDYRAIGRHAANILRRRGHQRILFLTPDRLLGGDLEAEKGFREAFGPLSVAGGDVRVIRHRAGAEGVRAALSRCLSRCHAPTALLISSPLCAVTVASHLLCQGLRIPDQVSVICRDGSEYLRCFSPEIARYEVDWSVYARRCARTLIQLATAGRLMANPRRQMARFVPGQSVGPPGSVC